MGKWWGGVKKCVGGVGKSEGRCGEVFWGVGEV